MNNLRLGLFICECGDQISSILDTDALERSSQELPGVAIVRRMRYPCSPDGLAVIRSAIIEEELDRVLVAGCSPRTLGPRFRAACEEAGLNADSFELVNIRELCAWVHQEEPQAATAKALDLIRMGATRVTLRDAHQPISAEVIPAALVIGGGLAGMTAALTLADAGLPVKLVERETALGGLLRHIHTLYPDGRSAAELIAERIELVTGHPQIEVLLDSQVTSISGTVGHYTASIHRSVRHQNGALSFDVGAIIVATGARALQPRGLFRYDGQRVVTQLEFERELRDGASNTTPEGTGVNDSASFNQLGHVVMILCAGQRNKDVPYCSRICCMVALKQAIKFKTICPQADVTILFRDLCLPDSGILQTELARARQNGVRFIRYAPALPPVVTTEVVEIHDELSGANHRLPYDRVVLAVPLVPPPDATIVAHMLNIPQDQNGFFPDVRFRLRPQYYAERGIYVCGAAHYPVDWREAEFQAMSAAFRAVHYLQSGMVTTEAHVAVVDEKLCTGCGHCVATCPFGAISMHKQETVLDLSRIDPMLCKGCGNCVVACPAKAIRLPQSSDRQMLAEIEAALTTALLNSEPRILAFGCEWSGYAAAELAGAKKLSYPSNVRLIRVGCSARVDLTHVLWAFFCGADGVFLGACPPGQCHYVSGNSYAQERINTLQSLLAERGFDRRRLRLEWITPDDPRDFAGKITGFANLIRALGPSPARSE